MKIMLIPVVSDCRVVMKDLSDFFRTTAVSKMEFRDKSAEEMLRSVTAEKVQFTLHTEDTTETKSKLFQKKKIFQNFLI